MTNRTRTSLFAVLSTLMLAAAGCTSAPNSTVADAGFHAKSWVDTTMINSLADRGDVIVANEQKGWYR